MKPALASILLAFATAQAQDAPAFRHLYTFGSREGIHPPGLIHGKLARGVAGNGDHPYGLGWPAAVATDLHGRIWIADGGTASVHVFDPPPGGYREIRKVADIVLKQPSGIASDRQGRIYLCDAGQGAVFVFDENGEYDRAMVKPGSGVLQAPAAVTLSEDQRTVYVADPPRHAVVALNREGEVNAVLPLPPEVADPQSIAVINNQVGVLGGRDHRAVMLSPAGVPRGELRWDGVGFPTAFAFDSVRGLFLVANPRWMIVQVFDGEGRNVASFGALGDGIDEVRRIDAIHVDPEGRVYILDSHHGKIVVFGRVSSK